MSILDDFTVAGSMLAGVAGAAVAVVAAAEARRSATRAERQATITELQATIALEQLLTEYCRALQAWADQVLDRLSEAHSLFKFDASRMQGEAISDRRLDLAWRISGLIERGRLFLPNLYTNEYGGDLSDGYPGIRPRALNPIKEAYILITELRLKDRRSNEVNLKDRELSPGEVADLIWKYRRSFVGEVQTIIDPREREKKLRNLVERRAQRRSDDMGDAETSYHRWGANIREVLHGYGSRLQHRLGKLTSPARRPH